ncbi:hypothetical protein AHIS1_p031 [Acaryochloris phage A-HIS1]|nr:hypothetical protein AHIS1_p031 [Acaryochloris phage A-HIS1]
MRPFIEKRLSNNLRRVAIPRTISYTYRRTIRKTYETTRERRFILMNLEPLIEDAQSCVRRTRKTCKTPNVRVINRTSLVECIALFIQSNEIDAPIPDVVTLSQFIVAYCSKNSSADILIDSPSSSKVIRAEGIPNIVAYYFDNLEDFEEHEARAQRLVKSGVNAKRRHAKNRREIIEVPAQNGTPAYLKTTTSCGREIFVSVSDRDLLESRSWNVTNNTITGYKRNGRVSLASLIRDRHEVEGFRYLNGNSSDFRHENLEIVGEA